MTPELNEVLYLHYGGFVKIQYLDPFINLKALWLNNNAITKIEGLSSLINLSCLYLQNNLIEKIEGLDNLKNLKTLVLSFNYINKIENLENLNYLTTLEIDHNKIKEIENLKGVLSLKSLNILNLSNNDIDDTSFSDIIEQLPQLRVLRMEGNSVIRKMENYRRILIIKNLELKYLDDTPIEENDRRLANAWKLGGKVEEKKERELIKKEKEEKDKIY